MATNKEIHYGTCPICAGSGRRPCPDNLRADGVKRGWYNYNAEDDTIPCNNCGGQTMSGKATGKVRLRPDMFPCVHEYTGRNVGRCLNEYTCKHCGDRYQIDSGD